MTKAKADRPCKNRPTRSRLHRARFLMHNNQADSLDTTIAGTGPCPHRHVLPSESGT